MSKDDKNADVINNLSIDRTNNVIYVKLSHNMCSAGLSIVDSIKAAAQQFGQKWINERSIQKYNLLFEDFDKIWKIIAGPNFFVKKREFMVPILKGFPYYVGINIQPPIEEQAIASLTVIPEHFKDFSIDRRWLAENLSEFFLQKYNLKADLAGDQLKVPIDKAAEGEKVINFQIFPCHNEILKKTAFFNLVYDGQGGIYFEFKDLWQLLRKHKLSVIMNTVEKFLGTIDLGEQKNIKPELNEFIAQFQKQSYFGPGLLADKTEYILCASVEKVAKSNYAAASRAGDRPVQASALPHNTPVAKPAIPPSKNTAAEKVSFVHKGNYVPTSGIIDHDGNFTIEGDLMSGCMVIVRGDLTISGNINASYVRCTGDLKVQGGIVMGGTGYIQVNKNIECEFIENADISCKGDITVTQNILNSRVNAGNDLQIKSPDGHLAGGFIYCRNTLSVPNIGVKFIQNMEIHLGVDWVAENRIYKVKNRQKKLEAYDSRVRVELRELISSAKSRRIMDLEEKKKELQSKISRCKAVLERLNKILLLVKGQCSFNADCQAVISGTLRQGVNMYINGRYVNVARNYRQAIVSMQYKDIGYITTLAPDEEKASA